MYQTLAARRRCVARERTAPYDPAGGSPSDVVDALRQGVARLANLDTAGCTDEELGELILAVESAQTALAAHQGRVIREFDTRGAYRQDACITTVSWLRHKTTMGYGAAKRRVKRAWVLDRMDGLRTAFEASEVATEQVDALVHRAIPSRVASIAEHDETLTTLARNGEPCDVAVAVRRIIEQVDRDGADDPLPCSNNDLREVTLRAGFSDLGDLSGTTTALLGELIRRVFDVYGTPDAADTHPEQRRTPGQRRHDALQSALQVALDNHPGSCVDGVKTHLVLFADLFTLLGDDELATIRPRLGETGVIDSETARHLVATTNPTLRMVLGLGPWLPVTVGRARRSMPDCLRGASQLTHQHCVAPGCTVRFSATDSDHRVSWSAGGVTALFNGGPMCHPHNVLKHEDGWTLDFNIHTGITRWTSADGSKVIDVPPADP